MFRHGNGFYDLHLHYHFLPSKAKDGGSVYVQRPIKIMGRLIWL